MSFRLKTILGVALIEAVLLAILVWNSLAFLRDSNDQELLRRAATTAKLFATTTKNAVLSTDLASLESLVKEVLHNPGLVYARVLNQNGVILAAGGDPSALQRPFHADQNPNEVDDGVFDTYAPISEAGVEFGRVELGLATNYMHEILVAARQRALLIALIEMGLVALFSLLLSLYLTRQLRTLMAASQSIAGGELGYQIPVYGRDELAQTAVAFNQMSLRLRELYREVREEELRKSTMLNAALDCIIAIDQDGRITEFNPAAEATFGYRREEVLGKSLAEHIIPPALREAHRRGMANYLATGKGVVIGKRIEIHALRADQTEFPVELSVIALHSLIQPTFVAYLRDITARKQAESAMDKARKAAEEAVQMKSQFLANMSHEIRTPMHGVLGMLDLLNETKLEQTQQEYLHTARRSAKLLLGVLNDILDFSRIEAGELRLEHIDFDVGRNVENVTTLLAEQARGKGVEVACLVAADVPRTVRGDPGRLNQVLMNLVGNAVKFTDEGEVIVRVQVEQEPADAVILNFMVQDTGIGIDPAVQERLFRPFSQADGSTSRRYGGSGLGLVISKQLVEMMGGQIQFTSIPGQGSTFRFTARFTHPTRAPARSLARVRTLTVDDNATNRLILADYLNRWGMRNDNVGSGEEALATLRQATAQGDPYQLAIIDWQMPGMNGVELAHAIRTDLLLSNVRLLLLSSLGESEASLNEAGIDLCLHKPVRQSLLYDALATLLIKEPQQNQAPQTPAETGIVPLQGRVLLVEDNEVNRIVGLELLKRLGLEIDIATDGREAVAATERVRYDVVLMDCQMPEVDGFEATRLIRQREQESNNRRVPIIALTANAMEGDRNTCLAAGMDDYLVKPLDAEVLAPALIRWLPHGSALATPAAEVRPVIAAQVDIPGAELVDCSKFGAVRKLLGANLPSLLATFEKLGQEVMAELERAVEAEDRNALARALHRLKGSSGNLGAMRLFELCRQLEESIRRGEAESLERRIETIATIYACTCVRLQELHEQDQPGL